MEIGRVDRGRLARAAEQITSRYKSGQFAGAIGSDESRMAYLITRLPATFAANESVFAEVKRIAPNLTLASMLDLGAGPGTAMWAAKQVWPETAEITLLERDGALVRVGQRLASGAEDEAIRGAKWIEGDLRDTQSPLADLVVLSYAAGELSGAARVVKSAWDATRKLLVVIEPGTPRNSARVAEIRGELIAAGAKVVAPCPHEQDCPMAASGDWCHFAVRLERSAEHRRIKGGSLGYEDEKFSYVAFSKEPMERAKARIVRHPVFRPGHVQLELCAESGLQKKTVTRSQKEAYREARKAKWGDAWDQFE